MKKVFFALLSVLAIAFTSCKFDNANVTVSVKDKDGDPVADREVFYTDKASMIIGALLPPSPEELIGLDDGSWEYRTTNKSGIANLKIMMGVASAKYFFLVYDKETRGWKDKEVTLKRGENQDIEFVVNQ